MDAVTLHLKNQWCEGFGLVLGSREGIPRSQLRAVDLDHDRIVTLEESVEDHGEVLGALRNGRVDATSGPAAVLPLVRKQPDELLPEHNSVEPLIKCTHAPLYALGGAWVHD